MDSHTVLQRSYNMSQIKSSNTRLEILFRKYLTKNGIRGYRIKNKIHGKPDLYFTKQKIAIFIDGCFWHKCPADFVRPKSKNDYWDIKINKNVSRDKKITKLLKAEGINVIRFWEHEIENNLEKCYRILKRVYEKNIQIN